MFLQLIELVARIWSADCDMRRRSLFGESEMEKRNGVRVGIFCVCLIALILVFWVWIEL